MLLHSPNSEFINKLKEVKRNSSHISSLALYELEPQNAFIFLEYLKENGSFAQNCSGGYGAYFAPFSEKRSYDTDSDVWKCVYYYVVHVNLSPSESQHVHNTWQIIEVVAARHLSQGDILFRSWDYHSKSSKLHAFTPIIERKIKELRAANGGCLPLL